MLKHESKVQTSECNLLPRQTSTVSGQNENRTILLVMKKKNHSIHLYTSAWERGGASVLQLTKIIIVMNKKEKKNTFTHVTSTKGSRNFIIQFGFSKHSLHDTV